MNIKNKKAILLTFLWFIVAIASLPLQATADTSQSASRNQVIVSYIYNFAKNIEWPQENTLSTFNIALLQMEDNALVDEFLKLNGQASIKDVPINVSTTNRINNLSKYQLIFVKAAADSTLERIYNDIGNAPVLIITTNHRNQRLVMINLFDTKDQQIQFEVNKANILGNNLTPLPELILLGGTEVDVAKLYREGQSSLKKIQNQLSMQQNKLIDLESKIKSQKTVNSKLLKKTENLNSDIVNTQALNRKLSNELSTLTNTIEQSKKTIEEQKREIINSQKQRDLLVTQIEGRNQELTQQQLILEQRQRDLNNIGDKISQKEDELILLNQTINRQIQQLEKQQISIDELDKLVKAQENALLYLRLSVIVGVMLFIGSIIAYQTKRRDNAKLAQRSHQLQIASDKLELEKRKAESANRSKSAFLSLMSHELRTPLQSIIGYTDLIIEELKLEENFTYIDELTRVNINGERLLALINNTLDLATIEAGKMQVRLSPINLHTLVDEAIGNVKPQIDRNENELITQIHQGDELANADYEKLLHILVNLLSNSAKFTQKGAITIAAKNQPDRLELSVKDTGIGLSKEQQDYIFTRFHQVDHGNNRKFKGTGLGLSITQQFCELMGGSISVCSEEGQGTMFKVNIPLPISTVQNSLPQREESETI